MHRSSFLLLAIGILFFNFQCGEDDCFQDFQTPLAINLSPGQLNYAVGDTIWLRAEFDALRPEGFTLSDIGGVVASYIFTLDPASDTLVGATTAFSGVARVGNIIANRAGIEEPFGIYLQFDCQGGICGFEKGLVAQTPGTYFIEVNGLGYDIIAPATNCSVRGSSFSTTELLDTEDNLGEIVAGNPFDAYTYMQNTAWYRTIFLNQARNYIALRIE